MPARDPAMDDATADLSQAPKKGKEKASTARPVLYALGESFLPRTLPLPDLSSLWCKSRIFRLDHTPAPTLLEKPPVIQRTAAVPRAKRVSTSPLFGNPAGPSFNPPRPTPTVQPIRK